MKKLKHLKKYTKLYFNQFLFGVLFVFTITSCQLDESFDGILGSKAPTFTLTNQAGQNECLLDYKSKVVVLFFFGNSCTNCISTASEIKNALVEPYSNRTDYAILGLDFFNGSLEKIKEFQKNTSFEFPLLQNASNVATNYKTSYNRIVVIDKDLNVVFAGTQFASQDLTKVKEIIDNLLSCE